MPIKTVERNVELSPFKPAANDFSRIPVFYFFPLFEPFQL